MQTIKTGILPTHHKFVKINVPHELDKKAICVFAAPSYFLGSDTYWKDKKALPYKWLNPNIFNLPL